MLDSASYRPHFRAMETIVAIPDYRQAGTPLVFTAAAARKVHELIQEEGNPGFQYGFTFDEARADDDFALDREGVTLLVDPLSLQYLTGAEIDYTENLSGSQFVIRNPNAKTTCGCGSSFST
jgi:iron-sulfur cluster insertion protein